MQIASVFLLALLHLVLVLGWVVLLVVPLVPGVQPGRCWHPRDIFPLFLLRPFSYSGSLLLGPTDYGCFCISMFCSPRLDWVFCFRFFSDLFCFIFLIPGCALSHARSRTLARVHTLPLARGHACSCMPVWVSSWPGTILVPTFLSPPLSLWPGSLHSWCGCWPLGGGWVPSPSGVWGAAPGAFVLVCVVRVGWVVPSVSCALSGSPWFGKWLIVVAWRPSGLGHLLKAPVSSGAWVGSHRYHL